MTGGRKGRDDGDRSAFSEAMKGIKPLPGRDKLRPLPPGAPTPKRTPEPEAPVRFEVTRAGEHIAGRAPGIDRKHLRRLRAGQVPVDARIDLHGLHGPEARETVREALLAAAEAGRRCALVIHGRGHHSAQGAVLKESLPAWLAEPPVGAWVMAFASATPEDGGPGATYVLLRRAARRNAG